MMTVLCKFGLHWWQKNGEWGGRKCKNCHNAEVRYYDKDQGSRWVKVK